MVGRIQFRSHNDEFNPPKVTLYIIRIFSTFITEKQRIKLLTYHSATYPCNFTLSIFFTSFSATHFSMATLFICRIQGHNKTYHCLWPPLMAFLKYFVYFQKYINTFFHSHHDLSIALSDHYTPSFLSLLSAMSLIAST